MTLALDAMGGDRAPYPAVKGAVTATEALGVKVILVGAEPKIREELDRLRVRGDLSARGLAIEHTDEVIGMEDAPSSVLRGKRNASVGVCARLVKDRRASGFVSAGNTGAAMAAAVGVLGRLEGVHRPAIAAYLPRMDGSFSILLDVGANVDCAPEWLQQFAVMGDEYAKFLFGIEQPRVGLLSTGEEKGKGNEQTKATFELLESLPIPFVGNVEGRDLFSGRADVIVCDGFVGNIALKVAESLAETMMKLIKKTLTKNPVRRIGALLSRGAFREMLKIADYSEYGGCPLLGVNGVAIIGHGRSNAKAFHNALGVCKRYVEQNVVGKTQDRILALQAMRSVS
ncbi:MAG: hypothetical protein A3G34_06840 [Candidatus Lindowbacteria bacterium RIFCSPLOWO2_12_FULL_62_27]|nr:MAG: hypothetical protein A3G34_06840 [Candidatus Lindowbacteria bacterium RIFCSPLOWO2_12_FULL_62_27]OGH63802.1 MAG: hypothetical protein A3I06_12615 [Candidatus Lindowbacteria bacterium RIFCSPLOWO2_02_FULL_62_12]